MKTAVSIPDETYRKAEKVARRLRLSRSQLYARALQSFVEPLLKEEIVKALDRIYADKSSGIDPALLKMQLLSISKDDW